MKLKKIMPLFAIALGLVLAVATSGFKEKTEHVFGKDIQYFQFTGSDDSEVGMPLKWDDVDPSELTCDETTGLICYVSFNGDLSDFRTYVEGKTKGDLQSAGIIQAHREQ